MAAARLQLPRTSWLPVALTVIVFQAMLLMLYLAAHKGDPSALVCINPANISAYPFEAARTGMPPDGYDGQFYYAVARDPWRLHHPPEIDQPARQIRILYPFLAWLLSGGEPTRLFWTMAILNLLAAGGLAAAGAIMARTHGLNSWWGVLLPEAVCAELTIWRDLTDLASSAAIALMLVARLRGWPAWVMSLAAAGAVFSREQNVVVVGVVLAVTSWDRQWRIVLGLAFILLSWIAWVLVLRREYGIWPLLPTQGNLDGPLEGLQYAWSHLGQGRRERLVNLSALLMLAVQVGLLGIFATLRRPDPAVLLVALAGLLVIFAGGKSIYLHWWAYMRVQAWLPLALWIGFAGQSRSWPLAVLGLPGLLPWYHLWDALRQVQS